jgi:hypothetical protein
MILVSAKIALASDSCPLVQAIREEYSLEKDVHEIAARLAPRINAAWKKTREDLPAGIRDRYDCGRKTKNARMMEKCTHLASVLILATKAAGDTQFHGNMRMILWQHLFDLARGKSIPLEEKVKKGAWLAKLWEHVWEDLFLVTMREHGVMEAKGDRAGMMKYQSQLEIMAKGWEMAFKKAELVNAYNNFMGSLEKWLRFGQIRKKIEETGEKAEFAYMEALLSFWNGDPVSAERVLTEQAIPGFKYISDTMAQLRCYDLLILITEKQGRLGSMRFYEIMRDLVLEIYKWNNPRRR